MQPPPPSAPPQWSPDGQWWWDGTRWRPRAEGGIAAYEPGSWQPPPPITLKPSPGLRIVLLVALIIEALLFGVLALSGVATVSGGETDAGNLTLVVIVVVLFLLAVVATIGVAIRAPWSRVVAILAGVGISVTCIGLVIGIPILVTAARAPDLRRRA
jgi:hypothetical protein